MFEPRVHGGVTRIVVCLCFLLSAFVAFLVTKNGGSVFRLGGGRVDGDSPGLLEGLPKPQLSEKEIAKQEAVEDKEIEEEETKAGEGCLSMRLKHPGMVHGLKMQFIHLPKTGGSSVQMDISTWAAASPRVYQVLWNTNEYLGSSFKCPLRAIEGTLLLGHRGWGYCEEVERSKPGLFTVTAVRSPVSRMVSLYDYNMLKRGTEKAKRIFGGAAHRTRYTLRDLILKYNETTDIVEPGSQQCRYMCGYECLGPNAHQNETITEEYMLKRALENLKNTDAVAITDHLNGLLDQLKFHVPWIPRSAEKWSHQNSMPDSVKSILDNGAEVIMAKWGWADAALYAEATKIAEEKNAHVRKCLARVHRG